MEIQEHSDSLSQCIITRKDETIWVMCDECFLSELEDEDYSELKKYGICPKSSVIIQVGLNSIHERSASLAKWFCENLLLRYPESVIMAFDKYYSVNTVEDIPYSEA
jgi:hypothetical protein